MCLFLFHVPESLGGSRVRKGGKPTQFPYHQLRVINSNVKARISDRDSEQLPKQKYKSQIPFRLDRSEDRRINRTRKEGGGMRATIWCNILAASQMGCCSTEPLPSAPHRPTFSLSLLPILSALLLPPFTCFRQNLILHLQIRLGTNSSCRQKRERFQPYLF